MATSTNLQANSGRVGLNGKRKPAAVKSSPDTNVGDSPHNQLFMRLVAVHEKSPMNMMFIGLL
ncbi:MAG: hypothetical protein ABJZ55_20970 [Fuerstiella sp.]